MQSRTKIILSFFILLLPLPYVIVETVAPSAGVRNVFFYADSVIYESILQTGHVNSEVLNNPDYVQEYWSKINNRKELPILSILIAECSLITGVEFNILYSHFPGYLFVILLYFVLLRLFASDFVALIVATAGGIGPNIGPINALGFSSFKYGMILMFVFFLIKIGYSTNCQKKSISILILPSIFVWMFYLYPRLFFVLPIMVGILFIWFNISKDGVAFPYLLVSVVLSVLISTRVFTIPLDAYLGVIIRFISLGGGQFIIPIGLSGSIPSSALSTSPYGLLALPVAFLISIYGGYVVVKQSFILNQQDWEWKVITIWGFVTFVFATAHLLSGVVWIASRVYVVAFPVIIVGAGIGLAKFRYVMIRVSLAFLILSSSMFAFTLISSSDRLDIQSYDEDTLAAAEWHAKSQPVSMYGDMKFGALMASEGYDKYRYPILPNREKKIDSIFYSNSTNPTNNGDIFIFYRDMTATGLYIPEFLRVPVDKSRKNMLRRNNSVIYTNGETVSIT